jgi:F-type H+-transporting ATPase subunit b
MHVEGLISFNWTLVMVLVTFLVLYLILKKYFFEKVRNFMQARAQKITDAFDNAEELTHVAENRLAAYNEQLDSIEHERREILSAAKLTADERSKEIIREAEEKATELLITARSEIELEKDRALQDMREQVAMLAVYAAEKIIEQKLDVPAQQAIVNGVIDQAGRSGWKI